MANLTPTFGWLDFPDYRGWMPDDPDFPRRNNFVEPGLEGDRLKLTGSVLTRGGAPMSNVVLEFWQADRAGKYHMAEYKLRDRQRTNADGRYALATFIPGYAGPIRRINFIAEATVPGRKQSLLVTAAIFFATDAELKRSVRGEDRAYVRPGAHVYGDDPAYLPLEKLLVKNGVMEVTYDIVFDIE